MLLLYNSPPDLLCCTQVQVTQKLAYTSWDQTWDLIVAIAHAHIDKFQVLHRNDRTPNFLSYVCSVNEAQYVPKHNYHLKLDFLTKQKGKTKIKQKLSTRFIILNFQNVKFSFGSKQQVLTYSLADSPSLQLLPAGMFFCTFHCQKHISLLFLPFLLILQQYKFTLNIHTVFLIKALETVCWRV